MPNIICRFWLLNDECMLGYRGIVSFDRSGEGSPGNDCRRH